MAGTLSTDQFNHCVSINGCLFSKWFIEQICAGCGVSSTWGYGDGESRCGDLCSLYMTMTDTEQVINYTWNKWVKQKHRVLQENLALSGDGDLGPSTQKWSVRGKAKQGKCKHVEFFCHLGPFHFCRNVDFILTVTYTRVIKCLKGLFYRVSKWSET